MSKNTIPTSILDQLVEDLLALTADGFLEAQAYAAHPGGGNAVTVETYTDEGEIDGRYTVTFNIEKQEN